MSAKVDAGGSLTEYFFEYAPSGQEACLASEECARTPRESLGSASEGVAVRATIEGLTAETTYVFRVVAVNANNETSAGVETRLTTFPTTVFDLPDGRGYELVTPEEDDNGIVYAPDVFVPEQLTSGSAEHGIPTFRPMQASAAGSGVEYLAEPSAGAGGGKQGAAFLAFRGANGGWTRTSIQPSEVTSTGGDRSGFYMGFSSDLSVGIIDSEFPLVEGVPGGGYCDMYERLASGVYSPFFSAEGAFGYFGSVFTDKCVLFVGASKDFSHVLFGANGALTPEAEENPPGAKHNDNDLYDSVGGELHLVDVRPDGQPARDATLGSEYRGRLENNPVPQDYSHAVSDDGSSVFWTDLETNDLFVRENDAMPQSPIEHGECVVPADACTALVSEGGQFLEALPDGSKALYTKEGGLYAYEAQGARTTGLVAPSGGVLGVLGTSEDGEFVYFAAEGVLAGENGEQRSPESGKANLYVWHAGVTTFIAALSRAEQYSVYHHVTFAPVNDWQASLGLRTAKVTPDGQSVVFMSDEGLIEGYDNTGPGGPMSEVYVYDAVSARLVCASCDPSGEAPPVEQLPSGIHTAAYLPVDLQDGVRQPRWISADGRRVLFVSVEPLVAQDTNGAADVYEWERYEADNPSYGCTNAAGESSFENARKRERGCVFLLSGGTSADNSYLLDASENADDVFVISRALLTAEAGDEADKLYDVRVGAVQPPAGRACTGSGCQGVPGASPVFATPSSVTYNGVGNFSGGTTISKPEAKARPLTRAQRLARTIKACKRTRTRAKRVACEKAARKRYGQRKGGVSRSERRSGS